MNIFLDFDDTLFDVKKFKRELFWIFHTMGFSLDSVEVSYRESIKLNYLSGIVYSPKWHFRILCEKHHVRVNMSMYKKIEDFLDNDFSHYVFDDAVGFLQYFHKEHRYILSFGDDDFQRQKIRQSGIERLFSHIYITQGEKYETIARVCEDKREQIYFLDDSEKMISSVKNRLPWVTTLLVSRFGDARHKEGKVPFCDFVVRDLWEARDIIRTNNTLGE